MKRQAIVVTAVLAVAGPVQGREGGTGEYVDLMLGIKATAGGNVWTDPESVPFVLDKTDIGFSHLRGGAGAGGGIFVEARFVKYVALELALLYEWNALYEDISIAVPGFVAQYRNTLTTHVLRIPLIVKGVLPLPGVRLAIGLGPEFVAPVAGEGTVTGLNVATTPYSIRTETKTSTMLTIALDITPELGKNLILPISLHASWNGTQPKDYAGRVPSWDPAKPDELPNTFLVQNTWDFRLQVGLGYEF
jgi:hypothetical protein